MAKRIYTLSDVAERTGISMNTLLRYKKLHQSRIPSVGKGRTQRYPKDAFAVFAQIKQENLAKRGREAQTRRKSTRESGPAKRAKKEPAKAEKTPAASGAGEELLTLKKVAELSRISYGTAARYAKLHRTQIPSVGEGRKRRYPGKAVAVFKAIRSESKPGRKPSAKKRSVKGGPPRKGIARRQADVSNAALSKRITRLEQVLAGISKQLRQIAREVKRPVRVTIGG